MAITAAEILNVRREAIGDSADTATLPDADIAYYWDNGGEGAVLLTAACLCDMLANRNSKSFRFSAVGQSMNVNDRVKQYQRAAIQLRRRYFSSGTITVTHENSPTDGPEYTVAD